VSNTPAHGDFQLRKASIRADLTAAQEALGNTLADVAERWSQAGPSQDWTVRDLLAHLAWAEVGHLGSLKRMSSGQGGVPADFDPDRWNAGQQRRSADLDVDALRGRLEAAHAEMLDVLDGLSESELGQSGHLAVGGEGTVEDLCRLVASHKREHIQELRVALETPRPA